MPSYTTSLKLLQPSTGEYPGSWGSEINTRMTSLVDAAVAGTTTVTMTAANVTLTNANGVADQAKSMFLVLQGSPGGSYEVIVPSASKLYFVTNSTGFAQTVKTSAGSGISVPNGASMTLRCDGTDVVAAQNYFASMTLGSALPVASGGTGAATFTANNVLLGNGTSALQVVAPGTAGNILTSNGTTWASSAPASAVSTISFGSTGLTPSTATSGAVSVAGTLATTNGGTGLTSFTSGGVVYASSTSALATGSGLVFDGTNLGVGTSSPSYKLDVVSGSGTLAKFTRGSIQLSAFIGASEAFWGTDTNHPLAFTTNGTEKMRLDASGNLGLGVTPSAWGGGMKALEMSNGSVSISANGPYINQNAFYDTAWKYKENGFAAQYQQNNGIHQWYIAPSGTAGNAISFTQAMTLDSSGNLGIGTSSPGSKLDVNGTATFAGGAQTTPVAVTFSATAMTVDCALSNVFATTFTANVTTAPTISNPRNGQTINWFITQDGTGSRTMTWPTSFRWPSGATRTLSTTANSVDLLVATYLSSTGFWYASLSKGFTA